MELIKFDDHSLWYITKHNVQFIYKWCMLLLSIHPRFRIHWLNLDFRLLIQAPVAFNNIAVVNHVKHKFYICLVLELKKKQEEKRHRFHRMKQIVESKASWIKRTQASLCLKYLEKQNATWCYSERLKYFIKVVPWFNELVLRPNASLWSWLRKSMKPCQRNSTDLTDF